MDDKKLNVKLDQILMRDAVIGKIYSAAKLDKNIIFISADFGAKALDKFRNDLPEQFIHAGISEQNMIDLACGLSLSGKRVFLYAMAPFITARCYEQVKSVLSSMGLPVTLIAVGAGLGYDHATLTHFTPEDVACMRALNGIEILSPSDTESAEVLAQNALERPAFRYIRLERQAQDNLYGGSFSDYFSLGFAHLSEGDDVAILATGYMVHKALRATQILKSHQVSAGVIDVFRLKKINNEELAEVLLRYKVLVTAEEQMLEGAMGSAIIEMLNDRGISRHVRRLGIQDGFEVVNGNRDFLHKEYGIDTDHIVEAALTSVEA